MPTFARAILLLFLLSGCASERGTSFAPTQQEARLVELMSQRLAIANEVAWVKYRNQLPVQDAKREAEVLDRLTTLAVRNGLSPDRAKDFFTAQITASRAEQEDNIRRWAAGATLPVRAPQSLKTDLRPRIDTIDRELISLLARTKRPRGGLASFANASFRGDGFSRTASSLAAAALR